MKKQNISRSGITVDACAPPRGLLFSPSPYLHSYFNTTYILRLNSIIWESED